MALMTRQDQLRVLESLQTLLTPRKAWIKGLLARDSKGFWTDLRSPSAVSFCLFGGIQRCLYNVGRLTDAALDGVPSLEETKILNDMVYLLLPDGEDMLNWNDRQRRKWVVLDLISQTIERIQYEMILEPQLPLIGEDDAK